MSFHLTHRIYKSHFKFVYIILFSELLDLSSLTIRYQVFTLINKSYHILLSISFRNKFPNVKDLNTNQRVYYSQANLKKSYLNKKNNKMSKPVKCSVCPKTFKNRYDLTVHFRNHTDERPFACKICNHKFKTKRQVSVHAKWHSDSKPFSCLWCDKSFKIIYALMNHLRVHTNEKPNFCNECPDAFSSYTSLHQHVFRSHGGKSRNKYDCEVCNKSFYSSCKLTEHMRIHTGEKPYSCTVCGKTFVQKSGLGIHSALHSEAKLNCSKCPKTFRFKSNLRTHIAIMHSNIRPYDCGICGKSYATKQRRDEHTASHLNEKPFPCQAYVISITDFVINIWGVRSTGLETIQKKINIFVLAYFLPTLTKKRAKSKLAEVDINQFLEKLDLLTVCERRKLSLLKFVFKKRHFTLFDGFFTNKNRSRRELDRLNVPGHRTALYKQSLKWSGTTVWNEYYKYFCICDDDVTYTEFVEICKRQIVYERGKIYV
ncbi:unnamed protein product [Orchesella dallaii]|uniref:C2H2-type domain-containing protein n=1 Tax=Orchesella dallaii TaxID=48710 RepID=A0ABP1RJI7_9HEXA